MILLPMGQQYRWRNWIEQSLPKLAIYPRKIQVLEWEQKANSCTVAMWKKWAIPLYKGLMLHNKQGSGKSQTIQLQRTAQEKLQPIQRSKMLI
jgi:hypothetical protein